MKKGVLVILSGIIMTLIMPFSAFAETAGTTDVVESVRQVQQYNFSINILVAIVTI